ncbi:restriction endonuclease [Methanosarcina sp. MSH10X1]|uniref:restriction endonuclease n=1 Tax=Methanosarcina sp. MSH10X1 TaxID=2507075 RepID=UPI001F0C1D53|nr:restriction endonuclease [Methanosarcina sp. MSH10X1]
MKTSKRGKRRKQRRSGNGIFKIMSYILVKPVKLLIIFSIYSLKSIWLLFSFSMGLLYRLTKQLFKKSPSNPALSALAEIDEMNGYKFEEFMKHVYEQLGYSVYHTPKSGDQGADLILTSKEKTRIAVQVKRYSGKVSNSAVQEVVAAKGFYKCTEGIVVTNSYFTNSARQLAEANFIDLVDRNGLEKLINNILVKL